jgi:hypothetical protein
MPPATAVLDYRGRFSAEEYEQIARGLIPAAMEDKWLIHFDGTALHLHRSWTGICVFEVEFEAIGTEHVVRRARVNRDQAQYGSADDAYDSALLHFLISNLLLGKQAAFPLPGAWSQAPPKGIFQHHISGTAYPERSVDSSTGGSPASRKPWWKFW